MLQLQVRLVQHIIDITVLCAPSHHASLRLLCPVLERGSGELHLQSNAAMDAQSSTQGRTVALITGVTGQDGSYLSELLLAKGYVVCAQASCPVSALTLANKYALSCREANTFMLER